jgi:HSP20 family protein
MSTQAAVLKTEKQPSAHTPAEKSLATRDDARYIVPPVDIYETNDSLVVVVDLPGVSKDAFDIRVEDDVLTIKGKADYTPPANTLLSEFSLQNYYRQFQLTDEVDQNKILAESKNGVLTIHLPKAEKSKPRQINVKLG